MNIQKSDNRDEKLVLTGMVIDDIVCGRIISKWRPDLFRSKHANQIAQWCKTYHDRYGHAPREKIEDLFRRWSERSKDMATVNLIERFLSALSDEYTKSREETNSNFILDVAGKHFQLVQMEKLHEGLGDSIADKDPKVALEKLEGFRPVQIGEGEGIDVLQDKEVWKAAFDNYEDELIKWPGALGDFFRSDFSRECFVSFEGPEGRGKSYWLMEVAFRAVVQRRRVVFFELGDMSQDQIMRRMGVRMARNPLKPETILWPKSIKVYQPDEEDGKPYAKVQFIKKEYKRRLTWKMALDACTRWTNRRIRSLSPYWKLYPYPPDILHCRDIETILTDLARSGWIADVVVIDYADLLSMNYSGMEGRDRINETWKHLRKISVKYHNLVVTASQTDAASNEAWVIRRRHFSEDKRKRAHITTGYGINQTGEEKQQGVMRLNKIKRREGEYNEAYCVWVAGCLALSNPAVRSTFGVK